MWVKAHQGCIKSGTCGVHGFVFSEFLIQMFSVLAMKNFPFESRRQVKYLKLKLTSF
jgi:hypothetical protein